VAAVLGVDGVALHGHDVSAGADGHASSLWPASVFEQRAFSEFVSGICVRPTPRKGKSRHGGTRSRRSATSAYSSTGRPAVPGCPSANHPTPDSSTPRAGYRLTEISITMVL